ncbi:MAG: hypothetical protein M0P31_13950 [Solirubrobacteraceae bacterium]|nr:hypothetical protein [Solirubrobacteraceae bacterium]
MCGATPHVDGRTVRCPTGHAFDVARQGYVHLSGGRRLRHADTVEMVQAREAFLDAGHYAPIVDAVAAAVAAGPAEVVVDVGAGTGHHLAAVLDRRPDAIGIAIDSSVPALRRAARRHRRMAAVAADAWRDLPVADGVASTALSVFAPRDGGELARILVPGGRLVVVTPTADHLRELVGPLGLVTVDPLKAERLARKLGPHFALEDERTLTWEMRLPHDDATALVGMGPTARHVPADELRRRVEGLAPEPLVVSASVRVGTYRRGDAGAAGHATAQP